MTYRASCHRYGCVQRSARFEVRMRNMFRCRSARRGNKLIVLVVDPRLDGLHLCIRHGVYVSLIMSAQYGGTTVSEYSSWGAVLRRRRSVGRRRRAATTIEEDTTALRLFRTTTSGKRGGRQGSSMTRVGSAPWDVGLALGAGVVWRGVGTSGTAKPRW